MQHHAKFLSDDKCFIRPLSVIIIYLIILLSKWPINKAIPKIKGVIFNSIFKRNVYLLINKIRSRNFTKVKLIHKRSALNFSSHLFIYKYEGNLTSEILQKARFKQENI